jgi:hypothetical protein
MLHVENLQKIPEIGCIFLDMDGTLLNDNKEITEETVRELERMQQQGVRLVIATGRPRSNVPELPASLHFDYYITSNGAAVYDSDRTAVYRRTMTPEMTLQIAEHFTRDDFPEYFVDGETHLDRQLLERMAEYDVPPTNQQSLKTIGFCHEDVKAYIAQEQIPCEKICVFFSSPYDDSKAQRLREATESVQGVHVVSGGPNNLEYTEAQVSKARAVQFVLDRMGLTIDQAMAFGDSENDLDLFRAVTYGIAVANASDDIKAQAYAVTLSNNDNGVAYALKKLIG